MHVSRYGSTLLKTVQACVLDRMQKCHLPGFTRIDNFKELQVISLQGRYPLSLVLTSLPTSKGNIAMYSLEKSYSCEGHLAIILAVASTDRNIQIWIRSEDAVCLSNTFKSGLLIYYEQFIRSATLSGHEDWVRSLAFRAPPTETEALILASGSQDGTIRLWSIEAFSSKHSERPSMSDKSCIDEPLSDELLDAFEASLGDLNDAEEGGRQISLKRHLLVVKGDQGV